MRNTPTRLQDLFKVEGTAHFFFGAVLLLRGGGAGRPCTMYPVGGGSCSWVVELQQREGQRLNGGASGY